MSATKLERLMNLIAALLHTRVPLSATTLRDRVGGYSDDPVAFRRQFSRDKEDLREMGITIRLENVPGSDPPVDGYFIDPDEYYLNVPELDPDELGALHLAIRLFAVDQHDPATSGLQKLGGADPNGFDLGPPLAQMASDENLGILHDAIGSGRRVRFAYHGESREVVPQNLAFRGGHWYVAAWDLAESDHRTFRLDRMVGRVELGEPVHAPSAPIGSFQPFRIGAAESFTAILRVHPGAIPGVLAQVSDAKILHVSDDGFATIEMVGTNRDGFRSWVLGFGTLITVEGPKGLREEMKSWLQSIACSS